ncbi:MAG: HD domain-containing protein, partial [Candidatus Syntrophoarchaeum sp.]|nr:HD domain-containing protein [Candidatus Syntrophoarchaeum sp.]
VVNWFKKRREDARDGESVWEEVKREVWRSALEARNDLASFADALSGALEKCDDLKCIPSDTRLPICSLYHHLKSTAGIAVCLGIDRGYDESILIKLRIAGLLHDIGKLRAAGKGVEHVKASEKMIGELLSKIEWMSREERHYIARLAPRHHGASHYEKYRAEKDEEKLLSLADSISSASDRRYEVSFDDGVVKSRDKIFPHLLTIGGRKIVLGRCEERKVGEIEPFKFGQGWSMPFYDEIVDGGEIKGDYKPFEGKIGIIALDIQGIHGFIREAKKLNALRGGSKIIEDALEAAKKVIGERVSPEAILFAGGGNLVSFLPGNKEVQNGIKSEIEDRIKDISAGVLRVAVVSESFEIERVAKEFDRVLKDLFELVEDEKGKPYSLRKDEALDPERSDKVCHYCFRREVSGTYREDQICEVCYRKIERGLKEKKGDRPYTEEVSRELGLELPHELSHIGDNIAVLSIDGNMMGRMFTQTMTPAEYSFKSESFDKGLERILKETIKEFSGNKYLICHKTKKNEKDREKTEFLGIDVIYRGGDDILIIMNAKGALRFGEMFIKRVSEEFRFESSLYSSPTVTLSCGIAIADHKFPIYFLIEKAEKLLDEAKRAFRNGIRRNEYDLFELPDGAISFATVTSAMPGREGHKFVLPEDDGRLGMIVSYTEAVQTEKDVKPIISMVINCDEDPIERLNLIKHLYSRLSEREIFEKAGKVLEKSSLEVCSEVCEILSREDGVRGGLKEIIPMVWGGDDR